MRSHSASLNRGWLVTIEHCGGEAVSFLSGGLKRPFSCNTHSGDCSFWKPSHHPVRSPKCRQVERPCIDAQIDVSAEPVFESSSPRYQRGELRSLSRILDLTPAVPSPSAEAPGAVEQS